MKKYIGIIAATAALTTMSGCSSMTKNTHAADTASFDAQAGQIVTRPTEYTYKTLGTASGRASQTNVLFWTVKGDSTQASIKGTIGSSDLENLAAFRAVQSMKGDAFFKLTTQANESGFWPFFTKTDVLVTGKVLKIEDLGVVTAERADSLQIAEEKKIAEEGKVWSAITGFLPW